jgi:uncharacterized HAD superfamily protein
MIEESLEFVNELQEVYQKLLSDQTPLDYDFAKVLEEHKEDLYES